MINGINNRVRVSYVQSRPSSRIKKDSFSDVLVKSSAKDTFNSTPTVERTAIKKETFSNISDTQAKLDKISAAIKDMDYSEMSKAEIYADIEKRYEDAFDNYHATRAISACQEYNIINNQFVTDVRNCIGRLTDDIIHKARGYSGTNYEEIEAEIKEKYTGKTGFVDQLNLYGELFTSGVLANKYGRETTYNFNTNLNLSLDLSGFNEYKPLSESEWLKSVEEANVSSPFAFLLNNPYISMYKEMYKSIIDDILFGNEYKNKEM